jgi:hypothetical protein
MLFGLLVFATFSPYIVLAFFNHPSADDFCYAISFRDPDFKYFFSVVLDWYRRWNARYFSVTLIGAFSRYLDLIETYKFVPLLLFLGWIVSGFTFLKSIFDSTRWPAIIAGGLTFCIFYVVSMPDISAGFYWANSAFQYQTGNILSFVALAGMVRIGTTQRPRISTLVTAIMLFAVVGSTELHMAFMVILVTTIAVYVLSAGGRHRHTWIFLLLVTLLSAALLILAPGNEGRGQHFTGRHQLWFSIVESAYHTGMWCLRWLGNPLLWVVTLLNVLWLWSSAKESRFSQRLRRPHLAIILPCWIITLFACFFIAFWSMGVSLPGRALNVAYFIFLMGWFSIVTVGVKDIQIARVASTNTLKRNATCQIIGVMAATAMITGLLNTNSFRTASADLFNRAQRYDNIFKTRYLTIARSRTQNQNLMVRVPRVKGSERPNTIMVDDITENERDFRNECYAEYFLIPSIKAIKERFWEKSNPTRLNGENQRIRSQENINSILVLQHQPNSAIDNVSCAVKGISPDGQPDLVFSIDMNIPDDEGPLQAITRFKLQRETPPRIYQTTDQNFALGVSRGLYEPLINNQNGRIRIQKPGAGQRLWLFACADGFENSESSYTLEARFQRNLPTNKVTR